eukprot:scaffold13094_cov124-Isochrysis_galbana.AAC.2
MLPPRWVLLAVAAGWLGRCGTVACMLSPQQPPHRLRPPAAFPARHLEPLDVVRLPQRRPASCRRGWRNQRVRALRRAPPRGTRGRRTQQPQYSAFGCEPPAVNRSSAPLCCAPAGPRAAGRTAGVSAPYSQRESTEAQHIYSWGVDLAGLPTPLHTHTHLFLAWHRAALPTPLPTHLDLSLAR